MLSLDFRCTMKLILKKRTTFTGMYVLEPDNEKNKKHASTSYELITII